MAITLAALALGIPAALFVLWPLLRREAGPVATAVDDQRATLEAEKASALRALRELAFDHEAGHMADDDYAELRARYEARASGILRRLDELGPRPPPVVSARGTARAAARVVPPTVPWSRQPVVLGAAGVALLAFGVALGILVVRFTAPAPPDPLAAAGMPGMPGMPGVSGMPGMSDAPAAGGAPAGPAGGGSGKPLPKEVLQGMLQAAHGALDAGRYQEAIAAYKAVLKREPDSVDAITHLGVILALANHADGAIEAFDRALAISPDYAHALWDKGGVLFDQKQDYEGAIAAWERFVKVAPPGGDRDQVLARIREAKTRLAATPAPAAPKSGAAGPAAKPPTSPKSP